MSGEDVCDMTEEIKKPASIWVNKTKPAIISEIYWYCTIDSVA